LLARIRCRPLVGRSGGLSPPQLTRGVIQDRRIGA
jgi:hypothetical protein